MRAESSGRLHRGRVQIPPATGTHELKRQLKPTRNMFSDKRELTPVKAPAGGSVLNALLIVGNWTNRYSTFKDKFWIGMNSTPPPTVQPVTVEFEDAPMPPGPATLF